MTKPVLIKSLAVQNDDDKKGVNKSNQIEFELDHLWVEIKLNHD